jgi:hypothetical protein
VKLLTYAESTPKLKKSDEFSDKYRSIIQYLSPAKTSGYNLCPSSSKGCRAACLFTSGRGRTHLVHNARVKRAKFFIENRKEYKEQLIAELDIFHNKCKNENKIPAIRLNGVSDIYWWKIMPDIYSRYSDAIFYDYTKSTNQYDRYLKRELPSNLHLTFSRSENNDKYCLDFLQRGGNVAVVFFLSLPKMWNGYKVYDGDEHDLRFLEKSATVCGLKAKGKAKKDSSQFVLSV